MNSAETRRTASSVLFAFITVLLAFSRPAACRDAVAEALGLCFRSLLPALFPFLVVSNLITSSGLSDLFAFPLMPTARLLRQPKSAAAVLLIGLTGGFAPAAAAVNAFYRRGDLDSEQAAYLLPACICSAPSFVILAVGETLLHSMVLGVLLFLSQIAACFFSALIFRLFSHAACAPKRSAAAAKKQNSPDAGLYRAVSDSVSVFIRLCGFVIFFRFLSGGLSALLPSVFRIYPIMLFEISTGCAAAAQSGRYAAFWCCGVLSLQSVSVLMQVRSLLPGEVSLRPLLLSRLLHLPISLLAFFLLLRFIPEAAVYCSLTPRVVVAYRFVPEAAFALFFGCCLLASRLSHTLQQPKNDI